MAARNRPPRSTQRGHPSPEAEATPDAQRRRVQEAVVALLCRDGYGELTIDAIAAEAGVSTRSMYGLYRGKEEIALATWEAIVDTACTRLGKATAGNGSSDLRDAFAAVLLPIVELAVAQPQEARVAIVEVLAVGANGPALRRRLTDGLASRLREAARTKDGVRVSDTALSVVAGGALQVIAQHLRSGRLRPLRAAAQDLAAWAASYETAVPPPSPPRVAEPRADNAPRSPLRHGLPHGRHGLPPSFVRRHQRARILETVMTLAHERGGQSFSVRDISAHAQISHATFYTHFPSREAALHDAFDEGFVDLFARSWYAAFDRRVWPEQVRAAIVAWTQLVASEPRVARFVFDDALSGGPTALDQFEEAYLAFARLLARGHEERKGGSAPALVPYALASGIVSLVGDWVADGRATEVAGLAAQLTYVVLTPFVGEPAARRVAELDEEPEATPSRAEARQELMLAFAELVWDEGYPAARLSDAAQRSGMELDLAATLFDDELDCAVHIITAWAKPLILTAAGGFLSAPTDLPLAGHRALGAALNYVASVPALTAVATSDAPPVLAALTAHRERYVELFFALIADDEPRPDGAVPEPHFVLQIVLDGVIAIIRERLRDGRIEELPAELPQLSSQVLTPFFGPEQAARVATQPVSDAASRRSP